MDESKELEKISILFQSQLQLGASPSISEFVSKADDSLQAKLLENLIEIEVQHRIGKESANRDSSDRNSDLDVTLPPKVQSDVGDMTLPPKGTSNDDDVTIPPKGSHANFEDTALPLPYHKSSQIGPYKLLQKIGEGGMGAVWMAEQKEPVRRRVALKLIKSDLASKEIVARFEAERQALAMMDHPNIATVLDVGTTDKGDPFFVMELIQGTPLNEYCDQLELGVNERLRLMVDICDAMQHAHQKGIIHRDLKPTNVLVTEYNGKPVPKVIDFGLAKALQHTTRLTDKTVFTEFGRVVGTLQYMSPEQAQLDSMDVDTRTDVYSLGVMLYELLAGSTPLDRDTMARNAILQVLELIREKDPDRPSHRLSSASTDSAEISRKRQIAPSKLQQILRGELDWIVMKALEKDRNRRYETASGFAADLERYLRDEPVLALPPSFNYRFKKFVRKNRVVVTAAALVAFALVAGLVGTTWGLFRALNAEAKALSANNKTIEALEAAEAANLEEATQRRFAEAVAEFVEKDFLALTSVEGQLRRIGNPKNSNLNKDTTLRELLDRAADKIDQRDDLEPKTEARIRQIIGASYRLNGNPKRAISFLRQASDILKEESGDDDPNTLSALSDLALSYQDDGQLNKSVDLLEMVNQKRSESLGEEHPATVSSMVDLGFAYEKKGDLKKAVKIQKEALDIREKSLAEGDPMVLTTKNNLASSLFLSGNPNGAREILEEIIEIRRKSETTNPIALLSTITNLATVYYGLGLYEKGLPLFQEAHDGMTEVLGKDHPEVLEMINNLAACHGAIGDLTKAAELYTDAIDREKKALGPDHPTTLITKYNLAGIYREQGRVQEAISLFEETLDQMKRRLDKNHPDILACMNYLASSYWTMGQLDKSIPLFQETVKRSEEKLGRGHRETQVALANLGVNYRDNDQFEEAIVCLNEVYDNSKKMPVLGWSRRALRTTYAKSKQVDKFQEFAEPDVKDLRNQLPADSVQFGLAIGRIGNEYLVAGLPSKAEDLLHEAEEIFEKQEEKIWPYFVTTTALGRAILQQSKPTEDNEANNERLKTAESLLTRGYEGLVQRKTTMPDPAKIYISRAINDLIEVYTLFNNEKEIKAWQKTKSERQN